MNNTVYHETFKEGNFHITMYRIIDCHYTFEPLANYTGAEKMFLHFKIQAHFVAVDLHQAHKKNFLYKINCVHFSLDTD